MLLICVVGVTLRMSTSTIIKCEYKTGAWKILKNNYYCLVIENTIITTQEAATVTSVSGSYNIEESDDDVVGFIVQFKTINYFPRGLETYFKNLKGIQISHSNLKEVHQEDLKPLPKLVELWLNFNSIEVLEEGLFDFNPDLELIGLGYNEIVHIEPNIFDHLSKLSSLWLSSGSCIKKYADNSTFGVKDVIKSTKENCINSKFSSFKEQLESLDNDSKILNFEKFTEKLLNFENTLKSSKFSNFRPLNYKLDALKESKLEGIIFKMTSDVDTKVGKLSDLVTDVQKSVNDVKSCKTSLDGFGSELNVLKSGQTSIKGSINNVCTKASIDQVLSDQNFLKSSIDSLSTSLNVVKNDIGTSIKSLESSVCTKQSLIEVKDIQKTISDSVSDIHENSVRNQIDFDNYQNYFNVSIDNLQQGLTDLKTSTKAELATLEASTDALILLTSKGLSDMKSSLHNLKKATDQRFSNIDASETSLNDSISSSLKSTNDQLKSTQDQLKSSIKDIEAALSGLKSSQNDQKWTINKIKDSQNDVKIRMDEMKILIEDNIEDKLKSFGEKIDGQLSRFKVEMRKELTNTQQKITTTLQSWMEQKLEKILEDKLTEIFSEKFTNVIGFN
ncbi:putative leucine-rich repeat-containing protein DDB_G0290503 isoform X2 [Chironomus tepperi]